jgi:DNA adenine methylase
MEQIKHCEICNGDYPELKHNFDECYSLDGVWELEHMDKPVVVSSSLRYPGGKTRACKILEKFVLTDYTTICSPFIGGGSFECHMHKQGYSIQGFDFFEPLVNYWKYLIKTPMLLSREVKKYHPISKEDFYNYRSYVMSHLSEKSVKMAAMYFVLNRSSFSGTTLSGGFSKMAGTKRFTESSIDRISNNVVGNFSVNHKSFEKTIEECENCFIYADPPYYACTKLYGKNGEQQNIDHKKLFEVLDEKTDWILSYDDCTYIRDMYKKYKIISLDWAYGMNKHKKSSEIIILSKSVSDRL